MPDMMLAGMSALIDALDRIGKNSGGMYVQPQLRRGMSRVDAAGYVGACPTTFDRLVREKTMPAPIRIRSRVIWDRHALDAAFDALVAPTPGIGWGYDEYQI